ncbi:hypothetical protein Tco_1236794 [Tanacetum coccineum]
MAQSRAMNRHEDITTTASPSYRFGCVPVEYVYESLPLMSLKFVTQPLAATTISFCHNIYDVAGDTENHDISVAPEFAVVRLSLSCFWRWYTSLTDHRWRFAHLTLRCLMKRHPYDVLALPVMYTSLTNHRWRFEHLTLRCLMKSYYWEKAKGWWNGEIVCWDCIYSSSLRFLQSGNQGESADSNGRVFVDYTIALDETTVRPKCNVPMIYMQQFWVTINKHGSYYQFNIDKKRFSVDMEVFREILQICPRLLDQEFEEPPSEQEILSFTKELGNTRKIKNITAVVVDHMHQLWRTFAAIINKCLSGKITVMTTPKIWDSPAYQTYLAFATGAATLKSKRIYKKPASPMIKITTTSLEETPSKKKSAPAKKDVSSKKPSRRQSVGVRIRDTPGVSVSKKKAPAKAERSKRIELLSDAALLEEAQLKKALKRSKRETNLHQAGGSSEGANLESEVPDEPKGKLIDTSEGTGLKPGVPDVSKGDSSESEYESWRDNGDEANVQDDEDVQASEDEPQHADDERTDSKNQETNDDKEETEDEFVHTPPNYVPTDDETNDESNDVTEEEYERINEELYGDVSVSLIDAEHANKEKDDEEKTDASHVNVNQEGAGNQVKDDAQATQKTKVHLPSSSISSNYAAKFLNFDNIPPNDTEVVSMLDINVQHEVPPTTSTTAGPDSKTLASLQLRVTDLEKDVKELKDVDNSTKVISTIKYEVPNAVKEYLGSSLDDALHKQYAPQKSIKDIRETKMEHARKQQKRKPDDDDKDEGPSAVSDQGLKRHKTSKDSQPSKKTNSTESSKGTSKSQPKSTCKSAQAEETVFEAGDTQEPQNLGEDTGTKEPPVVNVDPKDCKIAQAEKPPLSFDELMSTPINFSAYVMNHLKIDNLTQDHLVGPVFDLLKGTCRSHVELEYNIKECYKAVTNRLDWNNPEGKIYPFDFSKPLPLIMDLGCQVVPVDYFINNNLEYLRGGSSSRKYMTSTTKTKAAKYDI